MPYVKWRLGAVELTPEDDIPVGKNVLELKDVRETANYTCVAASDLGNIEANAQVKVKGLLLSDDDVDDEDEAGDYDDYKIVVNVYRLYICV